MTLVRTFLYLNEKDKISFLYMIQYLLGNIRTINTNLLIDKKVDIRITEAEEMLLEGIQDKSMGMVLAATGLLRDIYRRFGSHSDPDSSYIRMETFYLLDSIDEFARRIEL